MHTKLDTTVNFCFKLTSHYYQKHRTNIFAYNVSINYEEVGFSKPKQEILLQQYYENGSLITSRILKVN